MKIDDSLKKTAGLGVGTTPARAGKGADKAGAVSQAPVESSSTQVHISQRAGLASAGGPPPFDAAKVDEIKAAIAAGTFKVNPEKVAEGMLEMVHALTRKA